MKNDDFFEELSLPEYKDGFVQTFTSDVLEQAEFWSDDPDEFAELFKACSDTIEGRAFILFLVGHKKIGSYLSYVAHELGMSAEDDDDDDNG